jgi:hypothetical protein
VRGRESARCSSGRKEKAGQDCSTLGGRWVELVSGGRRGARRCQREPKGARRIQRARYGERERASRRIRCEGAGARGRGEGKSGRRRPEGRAVLLTQRAVSGSSGSSGCEPRADGATGNRPVCVWPLCPCARVPLSTRPLLLDAPAPLQPWQQSSQRASALPAGWPWAWALTRALWSTPFPFPLPIPAPCIPTRRCRLPTCIAVCYHGRLILGAGCCWLA